MTSCSDDAPMLQLSTQQSLLEREDLSPFIYAQLHRKCLVKKTEMSNNSLTNAQEYVNPGSDGVLTDSAFVALLQQRLSVLQAMHSQQQSTAGQADAALSKLCQPFASAADILASQEKVNKIKEVLQQLVDKTKNHPYGAQNPWTNVAAAATTSHANGFDGNDATAVRTMDQQDHNHSNLLSPGLGDLLPPPPCLPRTSQVVPKPHKIVTSFNNSTPSTYVSTSSVLYLSPLLSNSENSYTSANCLQNEDTSTGDKNQPLDLSTSTKRQEIVNCESTKENSNATPSLPKAESNSTKPPSPAYGNSIIPNRGLPTIKSLPSSSQNSVPPPLVPALTQSYLQSNSLSQPLFDTTLNPAAANVVNVPNWLLAAQQHQQVTALQQQQSIRKRSASMDLGNQQDREHLMIDQYSRSPKNVLLNNGMRVSSQKSVEVCDQNITPAGILNNANSGKRYKRYAKPPYSYVSLITLSILSSPEKKLRLSQILKRISDMFPFFKGSYQGWRDSVRHNLSQNECFVKVLKNPYRPTAKGNYWTVNISAIPHELLLRQNTLVSRYIQESGFTYRKDLTEVFDVLNGNIKVHVPQRVIKGDSLIEEPATVMEVLLLEPKREDDLACLSSSANSKVYCLGDMFAKDDYINNDLRRQHLQPMMKNIWPEKCNTSAARIVASKSLAQQQTAYPSPPYPQQVNNIELQKLAIQMMQNSQESFNSATNSQIQAQKDLLAQAFSSLNCLQIFQNLYSGNASLQLQSGEDAMLCTDLGLAESSEVRRVSASSNRDNASIIEGPVSPSPKTSSDSNGNSKMKSEDNCDITSAGSASPKDAHTIDSDLLDSISLPHTPDRPPGSNDADAKSQTSSAGNDLSVRPQSTDLSTDALFQPHVSDQAVIPPPAYNIPFTGLNIRPVELAKTM